ncbi:MAG TPA: hypothetical protein ENK91_16840 [Bacteroidetes bacterium]|nr:hypothetical protein [Bacteroidota bacterium]
MKKIYIIIIINVFIFVYQTNAQINTIEIYGSKSNGLGQVTSTFKDINALFGNQAGLAFMNGTNINAGYENRFQVFNLGALNFGIARNYQKLGTLGLAIKKFGINGFNEYQLGLAYARKFSETFSLGIQFNYFNTSITNYGNKSAYSFEIGAQYLLNESLIFGVHVSNPFPIKYIEGENIPTIVNAGVKYKISSFLDIYAEFEKHIGNTFFIKSGIEYSPITKFSIYMGFRNNFENTADYSLGFNYMINDKIDIDISTFYNITLGLSPSIGLNYRI